MIADLRKYKIEKAASSERQRPTIAHPFLDIEEGTISATNTYIAARVPVEIEEGDTSGPLPVAAVKAARARQPRKATAKIAANGTADVPGFAAFERPQIVKFPPLESIWERAETGKVVFAIGLSPKLLFDLAEALGVNHASEGVRLEFRNPLKPIIVTPLAEVGLENYAQGVLMPIRMRDPR